MAKFLNTRKAVSEIEDLIRYAEEKLILVSPYLKLSKGFKELLTYRNSKDKITTIIFGKQELKPDEMKFLEGLRFVILYFNEDLHAKCYLNDSKMIITSLNLYEFSMSNNKEMGVLLEKNDQNDAPIFQDALGEIDFISAGSQRFEFKSASTITDVKEPGIKPKEKHIKKESSASTGFCIRSGKEIPFNLKKPFSSVAYKEWSKYSNPEYSEKYCHFSGEASKGETSFQKPILKKNWEKAKKAHNL